MSLVVTCPMTLQCEDVRSLSLDRRVQLLAPLSSRAMHPEVLSFPDQKNRPKLKEARTPGSVLNRMNSRALELPWLSGIPPL